MNTEPFTRKADGIRAALKQAHEHVLDEEPVNVIPIRNMIDGLSTEIVAAAPDLEAEIRSDLANQLQALVNELDILERLITDRLAKEAE